jgi:alpha-ketoglutarate-dependent 2,4-dichlorophenoxyacetate dioxygenase
VIPAAGGETEFASMRRAWERLPEARRAQLAGACAWHDYAHSRSKIAPHLASERERNRLPPVCWRVTWRNPANGRVALFIASHTYAIVRAGGAGVAELIDFAPSRRTSSTLASRRRHHVG